MKKTAFAFFLVFLVGCPTPTPNPTPTPVNPTDTVTTILNLTNQQRGTGNALVIDNRLQKAAQDYAALMAEKQQMGHDVGGQTVEQRVDAVGYSWGAIAENVASGYPDANSVMSGWMNSPGHKANILNSTYTQIGIGVAKSDRWYYCQIFGRPR